MSHEVATQKHVWVGASEREYTYFIYPLAARLTPGQDGNYIYAKQVAQGRWVPIYIGEGELADRIGPGHHKGGCIRSRGATHFHCHLNGDAKSRRKEESDLIVGNLETLEPVGCNSIE